MPEEIRVVVKQETQGTALKDALRDAEALKQQQGTGTTGAASAATLRIEELKQKVAELQRLESAYTEKGIPSAASSVRTERVQAERELRTLQRQQAAEAEQAALKKAQAAKVSEDAANLAERRNNFADRLQAAARPLRETLMDEVTAALRPFYQSEVRARNVAKDSDIVADLHLFLRAPWPVSPTTARAKLGQCIELIGRILEGGDVWSGRFTEEPSVAAS